MNTIILSGMAWAASLRDAIASRISEERGQDLLEYAVLGGGIALVGAAVLFIGNTTIHDAFMSLKGRIANCVALDGSCGTY